MTTNQWIAIAIFFFTIFSIVTEKIHRSAAALAGAVLLLLFHVMTVEESIGFVDVNTIGVLVGMMLFVAVVKKSGLFEYIAIRSAKIAKGRPWPIMIAFIIITALLSGLLDNVTTVLLVGPMTLAITRILGVNPVPYFMTEILASNIGGTSTLIGDPPNIMIGSAADLSFVDFLTNTGPAILLIIIMVIIIFYYVYGKSMVVDQEKVTAVMKLDENKAIEDMPLLIKSVIMIVIVMIAFIVHGTLNIESSAIALTAAAIMLIIGKQDVEETVFDVEWPTIIFFMGLFVVVGGLEKTGVINKLAAMLLNVTNGNQVFTMILVLWLSAIISAFLDNIPFVATMIPLIMAIEASGNMEVSSLWWALSLGACLGGNGSLIGASANVVLAGISTKGGHPITFNSFFKVGFPIMILSIIVSSIYLLIRFA